MASPALEILAERLTEALGIKIEITIRTEERFTFSTLDVCEELEARCLEFFSPHLVLERETAHDREDGGTYVYMKLKGN